MSKDKDYDEWLYSETLRQCKEEVCLIELKYRDAKKKEFYEEFMREVEKEGRRLGREITVEELNNLADKVNAKVFGGSS